MIQTGCVPRSFCDFRYPRACRVGHLLTGLLTILAAYHAEASAPAGAVVDSEGIVNGHAAVPAPRPSADPSQTPAAGQEGYSYTGWRLLEIPFALLALSVISIPALSRLRARAAAKALRAAIPSLARTDDVESLEYVCSPKSPAPNAHSRCDGEASRVCFDDSLTADFIGLPDGTLASCNFVFAMLFGLDPADARLESNVASLLSDTGEWPRLMEGVAKHKRLREQELSMLGQHSRPLRVLANLAGDFGPGEELLRVRGYLFDITERRQLEERLRHAQRLELVGQLAGGIAHDFNNVLSAILGFTDLSMSTLAPGSPVLDHLKNVRKAGEQAEVLTRQLLAFSRHREPQPNVLNLNTVLLEMDKMLRRLIGENIAFVTRMAVRLDNIKADPGQITQVILNLVVNARDAMPEGGRLVIETMNVGRDVKGLHAMPDATIESRVMLAVSDSGCGMDPETLARIFEPFFTTKADGKGSGLGLATVHGIVQQSGGSISVTSEVGGGSTFQVCFPACQDSPSAALPAERSVQDVRGSETILIVEDDPLVRDLTKRSLQQVGYTVLAARTGVEALAACSRHDRPIDLLVTDVVMPGMSGVELAARFRPLHPSTPIIYMSGYTSSLVLVQGPESGEEVHFLQKPFGPRELREAVRRILDLGRIGAGGSRGGPERAPSPSRDIPPPL
ncbi:MAG: response regulator [Candidatus Hydrogenedentes bacterium]|nr:response regulator [Candidatus Hydrogenedentota bacterium]